MSDYNMLRDDNFDDDFDSPFEEESVVVDDGAAVSSGGFMGMSPVETVIIAVFVLLNIVAFVVILLIVTRTI